MLICTFLLLVTLLPLTGGYTDTSLITDDSINSLDLAEFAELGCATRCWENTKFVSRCIAEEDTCFCSDTKYQRSLHQCLHAQCETRHFDFAVYEVTDKCFAAGTSIFFGKLPTPDRDELRRREQEYVAGGIVFGSASVDGYPSGSVVLPTRNAYLSTQNANFLTETVEAWTNSASVSASIDAKAETTLLPGFTAVMVSATETPKPVYELFLGVGNESNPAILYAVTGTVMSIILYI